MRWLFVGEALVLRKEQRILAFLVLNLPGIVHASQEARSICLGRSEPRLPSRLCGKTTLAVLWRSRPFSCEAPFPKTIGIKRPALPRGGAEGHSQGAAGAPTGRA